MTDKKTPEELAEDTFNAIPLVDAVKKGAPEVHRNAHFWFTEGFLAGYEAGKPKWIKTSEQLPEYSTYVLCLDTHKQQFVASVVEDGTWTDLEEADYEERQFRKLVTRWQPLPESPKDL